MDIHHHKNYLSIMKFLFLGITFLLIQSCASNPPGFYTAQWKADRKIQQISLDTGFTLRYLHTGKGQPVVLMHTIRTQLDYFKQLIPLLENNYAIYAIDLPGHGYSSLLDREYTEPLMRKSVIEFIEKLDLKNVVLVGESIGGVLSLTVASELPNRIAQVVSLNPYDYGEDFGGGVRRSDSGWLVGAFETFKSYTWEPRFILNAVLKGGFYDSDKLPELLVSEFTDAGQQEGYRRTEYSVFANWQSWLDAKKLYKNIRSPVKLVYGTHDWSLDKERHDTAALIPKVQLFTLEKTGHFSSLEKPLQVSEIILAKE